MNISDEDSEVTFGGVTQKQREVTSEASKEEKQSKTQSEDRTGNEDEEPTLTGRMWADRAFFVLHRCLDSLDSNEPSCQPTEADLREQGFRYREMLKSHFAVGFLWANVEVRLWGR